ncbi:MAG: hypothetical protein H7833_21115, partial [Magnetococcus sp. DMHC-1]
MVGELDGIPGEIGQDLADADGVADQVVGNVWVNVAQELGSLVMGTCPKQVSDLIDQPTQGKRDLFQVKLAGLNLRKV